MLREDSRIDFFTQRIFWVLGGGGFAGGRFKKISKKSIFDQTNFLIQLFSQLLIKPKWPIYKQNQFQEEGTSED